MVLGVGIGIVDIGYEKRLANHLGARGAPSILVLINGRVTFFHNAVARDSLRQFVESLLPLKLVDKVRLDTRLDETCVLEHQHVCDIYNVGNAGMTYTQFDCVRIEGEKIPGYHQCNSFISVCC